MKVQCQRSKVTRQSKGKVSNRVGAKVSNRVEAKVFSRVEVEMWRTLPPQTGVCPQPKRGSVPNSNGGLSPNFKAVIMRNKQIMITFRHTENAAGGGRPQFMKCGQGLQISLPLHLYTANNLPRLYLCAATKLSHAETRRRREKVLIIIFGQTYFYDKGTSTAKISLPLHLYTAKNSTQTNYND